MLEQSYISGTRLQGTACGRPTCAWTYFANLENSLKASGFVISLWSAIWSRTVRKAAYRTHWE
jgi:hypothetical protein